MGVPLRLNERQLVGHPGMLGTIWSFRRLIRQLRCRVCGAAAPLECRVEVLISK